VAVTERIDDRGDARVIVHLSTPVVRERKLTPAEKTTQRQVIANAQARFASELSAAGTVADKVFGTVPAVALRADAAVLNVLTASGLVETVTLDLLARPFLHESNLVIESDHMWAQNPAAKGAGHAVAVLDTGVESGHPMFADGSGNSRVAAEFCASTSVTDGYGVVSTSFCPGGASTSSANGSGADCAANISGCGHGTHVAGIAAGSPVTLNLGTVSGVAPEADIIAVQVFSEFGQNTDCNNSPPCVLSYSSDQMVALEHVLSLKESGAFNVASVNMSLGQGQYTASCDADLPAYQGVVNNLTDAGIAVVIATGNDGFNNAVSSPACHSTAIAVGSTTKQDRVSSFSNVGDGLVDLYAPGSYIWSADLGDSYSYKSGTSMAAPHVAGAWALMHEATNDAAEREVESVLYRLQSTGTAVASRESGAAVGFNVPRINIEQASQPTGLPGAPTGVSTSAGNEEATISWTAPTSNGGYAITGYTVTASPSGLTCNTTGATSCTIAGLSNGTSYTFTVIATNSIGNSASSSASNAITPASLEELASGVAVSGLSGAEGSDQYFFIDVLAGVDNLIISLDVNSGDPDIYVDTKFPPPLEGAACISYLPAGNDETCTITSPAEGRYYIRIKAYSTFSGASLTAVAVASPGSPDYQPLLLLMTALSRWHFLRVPAARQMLTH
jgi:subtilisin family serine protease